MCNCRSLSVMRRNRIFLGCIVAFCMFFSNVSYSAVEVRGGDSLTTSGFSGIINVPSASTIRNGLALGFIASTDFDNTALMPRIGFGFLDVLEVAGGVDVPLGNKRYKYTGGTVGVKWKFWETGKKDVQLGISGNLQLNGEPGSLGMAGQVLFLTSWYMNESLVSSINIGKTFSSSTNWTNWDFGLGLTWWMVSQKIFQLALAVDFVNYDSRRYMPYVPTKGGINRGNVSAAARFGFLNKIIMFDVGATNIVDSDIALYVSIATSLTF